MGFGLVFPFVAAHAAFGTDSFSGDVPSYPPKTSSLTQRGRFGGGRRNVSRKQNVRMLGVCHPSRAAMRVLWGDGVPMCCALCDLYGDHALAPRARRSHRTRPTAHRRRRPTTRPRVARPSLAPLAPRPPHRPPPPSPYHALAPRALFCLFFPPTSPLSSSFSSLLLSLLRFFLLPSSFSSLLLPFASS